MQLCHTIQTNLFYDVDHKSSILIDILFKIKIFIKSRNCYHTSTTFVLNYNRFHFASNDNFEQQVATLLVLFWNVISKFRTVTQNIVPSTH